jgi:hypothetical protein
LTNKIINGETVIKAFTADDFVFFDKCGHKVKPPHHPLAVQISALEKRIVYHLALPKESSE